MEAFDNNSSNTISNSSDNTASPNSNENSGSEIAPQFEVVDVMDTPAPEPPLEDNTHGNGKYWGVCPCNAGIGATVNLAVSFFLVLFSFNVSSNFQTSLRGDLGYYALGVAYIFFALSSLCGSFIISAIGNKWALFWGSFLYIFFPISNLYPKTWSLVVSGALCGVGAGALWTSQGVTLYSAQYNYCYPLLSLLVQHRTQSPDVQGQTRNSDFTVGCFVRFIKQTSCLETFSVLSS